MNIFRRRPDDILAPVQERTEAMTAGRRIEQKIGRIAATGKLYEYLQHLPYADEVLHVSLIIPPDPEAKPYDQDAVEEAPAESYDNVIYLDDRRRA